MLEFILVVFILLIGYGYLLAIMEIRKINHTTDKSTTIQATAMDQSTGIPITKITTSKQPLSLNRDKLFTGTFSDRHSITENSLPKENSIQLMMQQIIEGTSLDDSKSIGETPNSTSILEKRPSAASIQSAKRLEKITFVADPDILKDSGLLFDQDIETIFRLNKTAKNKRQK